MAKKEAQLRVCAVVERKVLKHRVHRRARLLWQQQRFKESDADPEPEIHCEN